MTDFLDRLDEAIGCQQCGRPLGESVSEDFCSIACQTLWHRQHVEPLTTYHEPWDDWADGVPYGDESVYTGETVERYEGDAPTPRGYSHIRVDDWLSGTGEPLPSVWNPALDMALDGSVRFVVMYGPDGSTRITHLPRPAWRLPRSTGDLMADLRAWSRASRTAVTAEQHAACAVREDDLKERYRRAYAEVAHSPSRSMVLGFSAGMARASANFEAMSESMARMGQVFSRAISEMPTPTYPRMTLHSAGVLHNGETITFTAPSDCRCPAPNVDVDHIIPDALVDQYQRALEARRNRNTGPAARPLDPRRRR